MNRYPFPKKTRNTLLFLIVLMIIIDLILYSFLPYSSSFTHIDGSIVSESEFENIKYRGLLIVVPVIGFLLGFVVSLIPYKKLTYKQKYFHFSLITLASLYVIIFFRLIISPIF